MNAPDPATDAPSTTADVERWVTPGVVSVGVASLASDASHEQVTSLLPAFLSSTLHTGPAALGAIEGVADALTGLAKLAGGPLATQPRRRARIASGGYLLTTAATAAIGLAVTVWQVALLRALAWASRGVRSPARDALLMSLVSRGAYGRAAGIERAGDNLGALIGPLVAAALVSMVGIRHAMLLSVIPGLLAVAAITVAGREARRRLTAPDGRARLSLNLHELRAAGLPRALAPVACFELGNVAATLLILRASTVLQEHGRTATQAASLAILMYCAHNAAATAGSLGGGVMTDRHGPRVVFAVGAAGYVLAYALFAVPDVADATLWVGFVLAGAGIGLAETAQSALIARQLPDRLRGNGYGVLGLVQSFGDLGASLVAGALWAALSPSVAFGYAALWMAAAVLVSWLTRRPRQARSY